MEEEGEGGKERVRGLSRGWGSPLKLGTQEYFSYKTSKISLNNKDMFLLNQTKFLNVFRSEHLHMNVFECKIPLHCRRTDHGIIT